MRGKVKADYQTAEKIRITPAYAGKRQDRGPRRRYSRDHPRLCGEKLSAKSAPHLDVGITPAYAGKRLISSISAPPRQDHPRLCGEKGDVDLEWVEKTGSPPPMRGKAVILHRRDRSTGITPAYAGKRHAYYKDISKPKDHPRLCGEKQGDVACCEVR